MDVILRDPNDGSWSSCADPIRIVVARRVDEVIPSLEEVEEAVETRGLTAVGFIAYEAASAFDRALLTREPAGGIPLLCFGIFDRCSALRTPPELNVADHRVGAWAASQDEPDYRKTIGRIRDHIARGDTYQVNHTFRLRAPFSGDPRGLFRDLVRSQPESFATYLDLGDLVICSASPELFFRLDGDHLTSKPMKGTAERGWSLDTDRARRTWLEASEKNRAENAMIVDMVRNDFGRVAREGTVEVSRSFEIERHPTVFQMTSTVEARTDASVAEIMAAAFPFASVTGAPKIRTMELIRGFESEPRGVYTGAIGIIAPNRKVRFSVGIRTAVVDRRAETIEYGVGGGIVWDSTAVDEYDECVTKAGILSAPTPDFELLETILWEPDDGFALLDRHLDRLAGAAEYFDRSFDREGVVERLREVPGTELRSWSSNSVTPYLAPTRSLRVRLLVAADGSHRIEAVPLDSGSDAAAVRLGLAAEPVRREDPFLHFKTTHREVYELARATRPDCEDVLLWNERGEVTESTIANLVARIDGEMVTPPVECGLLAGTLRAELLERGEIVERIIRVEDLKGAESLHLINSVQGWRDVEWVDGPDRQEQ